jgi:hypothetical protein
MIDRTFDQYSVDWGAGSEFRLGKISALVLVLALALALVLVLVLVPLLVLDGNFPQRYYLFSG